VVALTIVGDLALLPRRTERALHLEPDLLELERFLHEVTGAALHRLDRIRDRSVSGHHDHGQIRRGRGQLAEQLEAASVRQAEVQQDDVGGRLRRGAARLGEADSLPRRPAPALESLGEVPEQDGLVLDDQQRRHRASLTLRGSPG
jgi:hypothetical protein